ncbi:MAG: hypothetical protein WBN97_01640, partial [Parvibaculum sp.]
AIMPKFLDQRAGEDTPVVQQICERYKVAFVDMPRLYLYSFHGRNTWTSQSWPLNLNQIASGKPGGRFNELVGVVRHGGSASFHQGTV